MMVIIIMNDDDNYYVLTIIGIMIVIMMIMNNGNDDIDNDGFDNFWKGACRADTPPNCCSLPLVYGIGLTTLVLFQDRY